MITDSVANPQMLAMMILKMWIVEHAKCVEKCLEEPPTAVDDRRSHGPGTDGMRGDDAKADGATEADECDDRNKRRLERMAIWREFWQKFWQDFRSFCLRFAQWINESHDQKSASGDPLLNASPLWLLAVIVPALALPDELWHIVSLLRARRRSEIGAPEAADDAAGTLDQRICSEASPKSTPKSTPKSSDQTDGGDRSDTLNRSLCEILVELKRIGRQAGTQGFDKLMTEPLTKIQLGNINNYHRNQVPTRVLPRYRYVMDGKRYRLYVKDMPPTYFAHILSETLFAKVRREKSQSHR